MRTTLEPSEEDELPSKRAKKMRTSLETSEEDENYTRNECIFQLGDSTLVVGSGEKSDFQYLCDVADDKDVYDDVCAEDGSRVRRVFHSFRV